MSSEDDDSGRQHDERGPFSAEWTEDGAAKLAAELKRLASLKQIKLVDVATACLNGTQEPRSRQQRLSRWVNHKSPSSEKAIKVGADGVAVALKASKTHWTLLKRDEFQKILAFVSNARTGGDPKDAFVPDAMFFGLSAWFEATSETMADLKRFVRTYTIYRHSFTAPGRVAVGQLDIVVDATTGAVKTREHYKVQADNETSEFIIEGFLGRRRGKYYIFAQHDDGPDTFVQFNYINAVARRGGADKAKREDVITFTGVLSDIQANAFYSSRFACKAGAPTEIGSAPLSTLPADIRHLIDRPPKIINEDDKSVGYIAAFQ